jgi:transposase-like protein
MTKRLHRRYSTECKLQVVQTYLDGGGSGKSIAAAHGIGHSLLLLWIDKYQRGELTEEVHLSAAASPETRRFDRSPETGVVEQDDRRLWYLYPRLETHRRAHHSIAMIDMTSRAESFLREASTDDLLTLL